LCRGYFWDACGRYRRTRTWNGEAPSEKRSISFLFTLFALRALRDLGLSPIALGLLAVGNGLGSLAGAAVVGGLTRRFGLGPCITVAYILATLADLTMPLAPGPAWLAFAILFAGAFLSDAFYVVHGVSAMSLRQAVTPPLQLGRVNATFLVLNQSLRPLGAVVAGLAASVVGVQAALLVGAAGMIGASAWLVFSPLPRIRTVPPASAS
jgi:predicted MFS family arabinose efflux permease